MRGRIVLLAAFVALGAACDEAPGGGGTAQIPVGPDTLPPPDQVVEDGEHVITIEGVKKAVLVAEQLYFYNDTSTVVGDTIQVSFFGEGGEFVSMLTAVSGVINQRSQEMTARGNVDVRSPDSRIETEVLHYEPAADRIWSDQPTVINQQGNVIRGQGVESDPALKRIQIRGGSAVLRSEPELGPRPRADTAGQTDGGARPPREEAPRRDPAAEEAPPEGPRESAPEQPDGDEAPGGGEATGEAAPGGGGDPAGDAPSGENPSGEREAADDGA